ncbi:gustatory receptor 5a for trehalose-like [Thrips palmi]|uniref:Gustatory receptor n=1 Tax=Thrips palmi TaxID=161013 RepID=A0A6P8Y5D0_THRPL|nr:gustatory receptor 5a for trehalose-like [Thrips palmi]
MARRTDDDDGDRGAGTTAPADEHPDAFANAMRFPLRVGQALSVLPVDAMTGARSRPRAVYSVVTNVGLSLLAILSAVMQLSKPKRPDLVEFMVVVFYTMAAINSWLFYRLGRRWWAALLRAFRVQDRRQGPCPGLRRKIFAISSLLLGVSFVEHSLSEMTAVVGLSRAHPNASSFSECLELYYYANYPMVIMAVGYWPFMAPFAFMLNFVATFLWNFNDLFLMSMGVAVASRFEFLRESIEKDVGDVLDAKAAGTTPRLLGKAYWRSARRAYNALSKLARLVDQALNVQLFVSFLNNLYFVCMQLLRGFDGPSVRWWESLYILFSFGFLVVRTSAVCLMAASVVENSRSVLGVLHSVCSEDYNEEVHRFLVQVASDDVALTGLNMFKVTRGLLLTVAGTILTYEVVLVQLH